MIREARELYAKARLVPGVSAELKAMLELNAANLDLVEGKLGEAARKLRMAREELLRRNSPHLAVCEEFLRRVVGQAQASGRSV